MKFIQKHILIIILAFVGSIAGYLYWHFIGCDESCGITSIWYNSTVYGAVMGGLIAAIIKDYTKKA